MGGPEGTVVKDMDGVGASQGALLVIVEGVQGRDPEGTRPVRLPGDRFREVVVPVAVAAQNLVGLLAENAVSGHLVVRIGVHKDGVAVRLQQKTGVAQPGDADSFVRLMFHKNLLFVRERPRP